MTSETHVGDVVASSGWRVAVARAVAATVAASGVYHWWVISACFVLTLFVGHFASNNLGVNTDTADMIAPHLDWRVRYRELGEQMRIANGNLTVVIEARSADAADDAVARFADAIEGDGSGLFEWAYAPRHDPFLQRNALLYLDPVELEELVGRLNAAQPMIGFLAVKPDSARLFTLLTQMRASAAEPAVESQAFVDAVGRAVAAAIAKRSEPLQWQSLLRNNEPSDVPVLRVMAVRAHLDYSSLLPARDAIARLRELAHAQGFGADGAASMRITGAAAMAHEEMQTLSSGMGVAALAAVIMVTAVLMFGLRSWRLLLAVLLTLLTGLIWTAAFAAFAVGSLNLISVAFAVLYIGLGVDYAIHLSLRYAELARAGATTSDALQRAGADVGVSLVLCAVTTGVGFLAFVPTDFDGVSELGIISAGGMVISLLVSLTLLPALLASGAQVRWLRSEADNATSAGTLNAQVHGGVGSRARPARGVSAVVAATVIGVVSIAAISHAQFDHNPINLRNGATESVAAYARLMREPDLAPWHLSVLVTPSAVNALAAALTQLPEVASVRSLADLIPTHQSGKLDQVDGLAFAFDGSLNIEARQPADASSLARVRIALANYAASPALASRTSAEQARWRALDVALAELVAALETDAAVALVQRLDDSLFGFFARQVAALDAALAPDIVTLDSLPGSLTDRWVARDGRWRIEVQPVANLNDNAALAAFVAAVQAVAPVATGTPEVNLRSAAVVVAAFQWALLCALSIIAVLLFLLTGSAADTAYVLGPLLLAALGTVAVMVGLGIQFNFANVICLPLLLGIGVDNGVHMVHRARAAPDAPLLRTSTARAVVLSALTTVCGFGNLAYSDHPGTASMGQVLTIGLALTLFATLLLVPALLRRRAAT